MDNLVSIGIPTCNRPELLNLALSDCINQTYKNIEIVVSDGCLCCPEIGKVVNEFAASDKRIKFFKQPGKITALENFKFVLNHSKGEYFLWLADDDRLDKCFIEKMLEVFEKNPNCVLAYSEPYLFNKEGWESDKVLSSKIATAGMSKLKALRCILKNQNLNSEAYGLYKKVAISGYTFPAFFGEDNARLLHAGIEGPIFKGDPGLLKIRLGGDGSSNETIINASGLKKNIINLYFGYIAQANGFLHFLWKSRKLNFFEKFACIFLLLERIFFVKLYRDSIIDDFYRFIRKIGRPVKIKLLIMKNKITGSPRKIKKSYFDSIDLIRVANRFKKNVKFKKPDGDISKNLLIVSLEGMNYFMPTIWGLLTTGLKYYGYNILALTLKSSKLNNRYYKIFGVKLIYWEDILKEGRVSYSQEISNLDNVISNCKNFLDFYNFSFDNFPLGKFAISTYCRNFLVGDIDFSDSEAVEKLKYYISSTYLHFLCAKKFVSDFKISKAFFTELNTDSYGGVYKACLEKDVDIVKWASSNRDNSFFIEHLSKNFNSVHHSSLSPYVWERIKDKKFLEWQEREIQDYFEKRYKGQWKIFARNYKNTKILNSAEVRKKIGLTDKDKIAIIYSHILYDNLYFYGTDLFYNYNEWLIETIRTACKNKNVKWFIKIHPSNIWRRERNSKEYLELVLIDKYLKNLPEHVKIIGPDTSISPLSWMETADFGVTVRSTVGLEMACFGKPVITAGTGRYENVGFTIDSKSREEYAKRLLELPENADFTEEQATLARKYAFALFIGKNFNFYSIESSIGAGKREIVQYNDMLFLPSNSIKGINPKDWKDVKELARWLEHMEENDYFKWGLFKD
ncbi:MAG: glycosyltransferase [Candidatus Humimicrobiaceae bacterium]